MEKEKKKSKNSINQTVLTAYDSVDFDDQTTLKQMCEEAGIDYDSL